MNEQHWQDWLVALIGVWLVLSNWVFSFTTPEAAASFSTIIFWNSVLSGAVAIVLGVAALASFKIWEEWADIVLGLWLIISPWILGFGNVERAAWNVVLCGLVIMVSAAWAIRDARETGHAS